MSEFTIVIQEPFSWSRQDYHQARIERVPLSELDAAKRFLRANGYTKFRHRYRGPRITQQKTWDTHKSNAKCVTVYAYKRETA